MPGTAAPRRERWAERPSRDSHLAIAHNERRMHLSARADYAVRALVEVAAGGGRPLTRDQIARAQAIPITFLNNIFQQLKVAGLVKTVRGADGGYLLTVAPERISLADIIRAVDGPLANVRGESPEAVVYLGRAEPLREVWVAVRASMRSVLDHVTLQDVAANQLPEVVRQFSASKGAWSPHTRQPWLDSSVRKVQTSDGSAAGERGAGKRVAPARRR